jgi:hypothetical protein
VRAAKRAGVYHIVKFSGVGADIHSEWGFLRWHGEAEKEVENSGESRLCDGRPVTLCALTNGGIFPHLKHILRIPGQRDHESEAIPISSPS